MINTVLFATDLGIFSPHILQHALEIASRFRANIVVVHAIEPLGVLGDAVVQAYLPQESKIEFDDHGLADMSEAIKQRIIDSFADEYMMGNDSLSQITDVCVTTGRAVEVILEQSSLYSADLIVMGRHSQHAIDPNLIGSVTSKVLQLATVPVYMVPVVRGVCETLGLARS